MRIQNRQEIAPYEWTSVRHGARISRFHGCLGCAVDPLRPHETRSDVLPGREEPIRADSVCQSDEQLLSG